MVFTVLPLDEQGRGFTGCFLAAGTSLADALKAKALDLSQQSSATPETREGLTTEANAAAAAEAAAAAQKVPSTAAGLAAEQCQSGTSPLTASRPSESEQTPAEPLVKANKAATPEPQIGPAATFGPAATASLVEPQDTALVPASAPATGGTAADKAAEATGQEYCSVLISKLRVSSTY